MVAPTEIFQGIDLDVSVTAKSLYTQSNYVIVY